MTKKDFEEVAHIIRNMSGDQGLRLHTAREFAKVFSERYERFKYDRFIEAATRVEG